jgi:hypothetical protein
MEEEKKFRGALRRNECHVLTILRIQFQVPNFHSVFHDINFYPNAKLWFKKRYLYIPSRLNTVDIQQKKIEMK